MVDEDEAIAWLCDNEDIYPLARDIVRNGLNPLERLALSPIGKRQTSSPTYYVEEGNRRVCALKLLGDPDRAPSAYRAQFEKLAGGWSSIATVPAAIISDPAILRVWLERTHSGAQDGMGRRTWDADQKQRFAGGSKNALAQAVLDYAQSEGMLSKAERAGKLTTAQRFLNNAAVQASIGIDRTLPLELGRTRPRDQFNQVLRTFVRDLVEGKNVTSRMNAPQIVPYANSLAAQPGLSPHRISREPLSAGASSTQPQRRRSAPPKLETVAKVRHEPEITKALDELDNFKLKALYYSICTIELGAHTPLVSVGVWSFFETLTALMGRGTDVSFDSFLSKVRLTGLGLSGVKSFGPVLARLNQVGNETKHHATAANFNNLQLDNDMTTLKPVVLACIAEVRKSS